MATLKEEFANRMQKIKDSIPETERAMMSEDLLDLESSIITLIDDVISKDEKIVSMTKEHDDLLKVNGRLAQRISFDSSKGTTFNSAVAGATPEEDSKIELSNFINEKGELK